MKHFATMFFLTAFILTLSTNLLSQTTITIGTGTTSQSYIPCYGLYDYGWSAMIFTKDEINAAGWNTSGNITKIAFYVGNTPSNHLMLDQRIYLTHTTASSFPDGNWPDPATMTQVFASDYTWNGTGWAVFTLSTEFPYNNFDNLLVYYENYDGDYVSGYPTFYSTSTTPDYKAKYKYQDNSFPSVSGTRTYNRTNTQLTFILPSAMVYDSSTVVQSSTAAVLTGSTNQPVIKIEINTTGNLDPLSVTQFNLNTNGTTNTSDIVNAKLFYTGTNNNFSTLNQFGSTVSSPNGAFIINSAQILAMGKNYFWLTYDISSGATENNVVDGECTSITIGATPYIPTITAPAGNRTIRNPLTGTKTIGFGGDYTTFTAAVADLNVIGPGTGGVTFNVTGGTIFNESPIRITATGTSANPIIFQSSDPNDKPTLRVTGTTATTDAAIRLVGSDYFSFNGIKVENAGTITDDYVEYGFHIVDSTGSNGCKYNTIKNCVVTLDTANASTRGIYLYCNGTSDAGTNSFNKFYNNIIQLSHTGYYIDGTSTTYNDDGNEIGTESGGTSVVQTLGGGTGTVYGMYIYYQTNMKIFNTTFEDFTGTGTSIIYGIYSVGSANTIDIYSNTFKKFVGGGSLHGIYFSSTGTSNVYKNSLSDFYSTTITTSILSGIYVSGGTTVNIFNNFVYDLRNPNGTNTSAATCGIYLGGGTTSNLFYNTVYIDYASTGASNTSATLYVGSTSPTNVDVRNNVFVNNNDIGDGVRAVAFRKGGTALTNLASTMNNNLYYAGTPGAKNLIYYDGTNSDQTLTAYKARMGSREQQSVTEMPPFVSPSAPYNLHINTSTATQVESGGNIVSTPFVVNDDFDGDIRYGSPGYTGSGKMPDIGADELEGTGLDLTAPVINYTALGDGTPTNRTITATITDPSGVAMGSDAPRLYYKKNTDASYVFDASPVVVGYDYTFTFDYSQVGGGSVAPGDSIYYYIAAQDSPGNSITNPLGGSGSNPPGSTPPSVPFRFIIKAPMSGTFTIGTAGDFPTITSAIDSLNKSAVSGPVVFSLLNGTYSTGETYPIVIKKNDGANSTNLITIKPASGVTTTISGSSANAIFKLEAAKYVIFDGSNIGGSSMDMTIINTNSASATAAIWLSSLGAGQGAANNTIKNCVLSAGADQSTGALTTFGIISSGTTISISSDGNDNNNNIFSNNYIIKTRYGIYVRGASGNPNTNATITHNIIGPTAHGSDQIGKGGIIVQHLNGTLISQNTIRNVGGPYALTSAGSDRVGIGLGSDSWTPTATAVTNAIVTRNLIHNIIEERMFAAVGIVVAGSGSPSNNLIANNVIHTVRGNGTGTDQGIGIGIASGNGDKVVFNSISMYGHLDTSPASNATQSAAGIRISSTSVANLTLMDNAISVDITSNTATLKHYAIVAPSTTFAWGTGGINYNDYYVNAANAQMVLGGIGTSVPYTEVSTLADWKTQFTPNQDANSIDLDPIYISQIDPMPQPSSPLLGAGVSIPGITDDFLGIPRGTPPSIGAYEISIDISGPSIVYTPLGNVGLVTNHTLVATIADISGVVSGANAPRIYYRKGTSDPFVFSYASSVVGNEYTFIIDHNTIGGIEYGDIIQYYVAAQDSINNVSTNPSGGSGSNPPGTVAPPFPNEYTISAWITQTSPVTTALYSVKAVNDQVAWATGASGKILRTTDGGTTWTLTSNPLTVTNHAIEALDENTAFVLANGTSDARMYRTTDGGTTWTMVYQSTGTDAFLNAVKMFDANNGYAQGDPIGSPRKYVLIKTTDGGATWTSASDLEVVSSTENGFNNSMFWFDSQRGWFGTNNNRIYFTTDGGATWAFSTTTLLESPSVWFKNSKDGFAGINNASNATPTIIKSIDGGVSWVNIASPIAGRVYGMDGMGDKVWVTSVNNIISTNDFGTNWSTQYTASGTQSWYHISMVKVGNDIHGWAVRSNGQIIKCSEYSAVGFAVNVNFNTGWNMISNPVTRDVNTDSVKQLYPTSLFNYVFGFTPGSGYTQSYKMPNGPGYWGKFASAGTADISGTPRTLDSINVVSGWNMVGSISYSVDTSTITSVPSGLRASNWFEYNAGYFVATQIVPGKAYWIKANANGKFIFTSSGSVVKASSDVSALDQFNSIIITDANGGVQTLYFGSEVEGVNAAMYEMPPLPPSEAFDARFEGAEDGYMLMTHSAELSKTVLFPISIQSSAYPLTITWKINSTKFGYELSNEVSGGTFGKQTINGEGQMIIENPEVSRIVLLAKSGEEIPIEFALMQNYPNPFNPVTNIKYALPEPSKVTLEIFNVLGQKVRTLINEEKPAGYHVVEWNGKNEINRFAGSGVYYIRISAEGTSGKNFTNIRKMILLR